MLIDFLKTSRSKNDLKIALSIIQEFKNNESQEEWVRIPFEAWNVFEWLEEYLEHLVNGSELTNETKCELERLSKINATH